MAYSKKSIAWAHRQTPVECACGCGVLIMPKPAWYEARCLPLAARFIRGHTSREMNLNPSQLRERAEMKKRPATLIVGDSSPDAIIVVCPRSVCHTRWQVSETIANLIFSEGCSFCALDDIVAERISQGIPVWPEDDLDASEGAIEISAPTYRLLKEQYPHLSLGQLAQRIKDSTLASLQNQQVETEVRDILDQCGLSEEYI